MTDSYDIKSAQLSLMSLVAKTTDLQRVATDVLQSYGPNSDSADFFENDGVIIDTSRTAPGVSSAGLKALIKALKQCHLLPVAFRGASPADEALALALGLVRAEPDIAHVKPATPPAAAPVEPVKTVEVVKEVVREVVREVLVQAPGPSTLIIEKPVRSGQKIYARGADLVVLAVVNQGGEIVADGHIHVYAPLRGKAMAGASGNTQARIFSTCLEPELISIAGVYRTSEHPLAPGIQGQAAQVRLSDDGLEKLLFEALAA